MSISTTYITLLRHGAVQGGACYRGITDDALSATGWEQLQNKTAAQADWNIIISSPLSRCYDFALQLSEQRHCALIKAPALQEINFGDWEGKTADQINPDLLAQFYADPVHFTAANAEPFIDFQQRVLEAWQALLKEHQGQRLLMITHAGVIRVILADMLGMDTQHSFKLKIAYASLSKIECFSEQGAEDFLQLVEHR
ncbi:MAG: hypothetical protein GQ582_03265 [Methyloprofundus sp.]|nr:hypothetical protein [Methyloprofundus sp.]